VDKEGSASLQDGITTIEGKIKNITDFGLFIGIDEGIDGLVHISDISWTKRIKHPSELYKKGDEIQAIVLNIDKENERFSLGIKQLQRDPWETVPERYVVGTTITGTTTNVTEFGVFIELEEGIEGLVHVSEIANEKVKSPLDKFKVGEVVSAKVLNINPKERRIGLSVKQLESDDEHELVSDYLNSYDGPTSNLGELLKENLHEKSFGQTSDEGGRQDEEKIEEIQPDEEKIEEIQPDEEKIEEIQPDEEKIEEIQPDEEKIEEIQPVEEKIEEIQPDEEKTEEIQTDSAEDNSQAEQTEGLDAENPSQELDEEAGEVEEKTVSADEEYVVTDEGGEEPVATNEGDEETSAS